MHPVGHKRPGLGVNLTFSIGVILDICVSQQHVKFDPIYESEAKQLGSFQTANSLKRPNIHHAIIYLRSSTFTTARAFLRN
jgi:hypothetical protein